ncbi:MAG TPA: hypothetical protein PJ990_11645 [Saprospiraceae bacterium]|nr:hypothetical protein [Saprospiraceae bacterium]
MGFIVIGVLASELQPDTVLVKIKVDCPALIAVTTPALLILAIDGFVLVHVPPEPGKNLVVAPIQTASSPSSEMPGLAFT